MNFDGNYEFNAPQYCDFNNLEEFENADVESYFDIDHEAAVRIGSVSSDPAQPQTSTAPAPALKENARKAPKNVVMGVQTLLKPGERPAMLRDVTNSPGGAGRGRAALKRTNAPAARDQPCAKQPRSTSRPAEEPEPEQQPAPAPRPAQVPEPQQQTAPPPDAASKIPTPSRRGRSHATPTRSSPRLAARRSAAAGRRRSVSASAATSVVPPPLPPRRPTPSAAAGQRRTPAASPVPVPARRRSPSVTEARARQPARRTPSGGPEQRRTPVPGAAGRRPGSSGGRRRSFSHSDATRSLRSGGPAQPTLSVAETPNVLRRGLELRSAARSAAERAVKNEQEDRLNKLRKQMAEYKKQAAIAKKQPTRPRAAPVRPTTVPQPFHLHDDGAATSRAVGEFKSVAQLVEGFYRKTPPRFHTRRAGEGPEALGECASPRTTVGRTPPLATRGRTRSQQRPPSREQLEEAEMEEARQHQVRARPVNRRVLEQPVGVPERQARPPTRAEPFNLTQQLPKHEGAAETEPAPEFHARPAPRQILEGTVGLPERQPPPSTRPQSPAFQLKQRMAERRKQVAQQASVSQVGQGAGKIRANPLPDMGVPFRPKIDHQTTRVQPFSFEVRDKQRQAEKEKKIQQVLEEERRQREFRAQMLPPASPRGVPERRALGVTQAMPFQLPGEQISAAAAARRQKKLEEEAEQLRQAVEFRAQPCRVTRQQAYQPRPAERAPVVPSSPHLHTDHRSLRRRSFDERQKQREADVQALQEEAERQRELEQREQVARLRREAVHRAQPVRHYPAVNVQPSAVPPTEPHSPQWAATSSRASYRSE